MGEIPLVSNPRKPQQQKQHTYWISGSFPLQPPYENIAPHYGMFSMIGGGGGGGGGYRLTDH